MNFHHRERRFPTPKLTSSFALVLLLTAHIVHVGLGFPMLPHGLGKPAYLNIPKWQECTDKAKTSSRRDNEFLFID